MANGKSDVSSTVTKTLRDFVYLLVLITVTNSLINYMCQKTLVQSLGRDNWHNRDNANHTENIFAIDPDADTRPEVIFKKRGRESRLEESWRTFGHRKRMQFALLPIMYKMGVMTTLLMGLTVLTLKGLTIGVILLIFAFGNLFSKFSKFHHQSQPIHVHVHSGDAHGKAPIYSSGIGAGPWDRIDESSTSNIFQDYDPRSYRKWHSDNVYPFSRFSKAAYHVT